MAPSKQSGSRALSLKLRITDVIILDVGFYQLQEVRKYISPLYYYAKLNLNVYIHL